MARVASRALCAIAAICILAFSIHFLVRPRFMLGEQVTLSFSKGVFINCLSEPTEVVRILEVGLSGIRIEAISKRLDHSFAIAEWASGCAAFGIVEEVGTSRYFIPFSAIATMHREGWSSWKNPIAA